MTVIYLVYLSGWTPSTNHTWACIDISTNNDKSHPVRATRVYRILELLHYCHISLKISASVTRKWRKVMDVESHKLFLAKGSQRTQLSDASIQPRVHATAAQRVELCHFLQKIKFPVAYYYYCYLWPRYWIPREWKHYAMQYKKGQKSSWNEPYSSSSFTKQSCSNMALHRWIRTESRWNIKLISLSSPDWSASLHLPQFK